MFLFWDHTGTYIVSCITVVRKYKAIVYLWSAYSFVASVQYSPGMPLLNALSTEPVTSLTTGPVKRKTEISQ